MICDMGRSDNIGQVKSTTKGQKSLWGIRLTALTVVLVNVIIYIALRGNYGSGNGEFNSPRGIALDSSDNLYVVDYGNNRIQKFLSSGTGIVTWGSKGSEEGQFSAPYGIAVDLSGNVYVASNSNEQQRGTVMAMYSIFGNLSGIINPLILGLIAENFGSRGALKFSAATTILGVVLIYLIAGRVQES